MWQRLNAFNSIFSWPKTSNEHQTQTYFYQIKVNGYMSIMKGWTICYLPHSWSVWIDWMSRAGDTRCFVADYGHCVFGVATFPK